VLLNALVGGVLYDVNFVCKFCEQEELVLGADAVMPGGFLGCVNAIKIMVKLTCNLTGCIRIYEVR